MGGKKCAVLFSGGKDSCLAIHKAIAEGYDVRYLLSITPENPDSFMFHKPYLNLLKKQADLLEIELLVFGSKGEKEKELKDLKELIRLIKDKVEYIVVGGIASKYQGDRVKKICDEFKLKFYAPLSGYKSEEIWRELFDNHFEIILTKRACEGLKNEDLGVIINKDRFKDLLKRSQKYGFRIDFEGGEAESAVLYMPEFKKHIKIEFDIINQGSYNAVLNIKKIK